MLIVGHDRSRSRKSIIILFLLFCTFLIVLCYKHTLPLAPLVSARNRLKTEEVSKATSEITSDKQNASLTVQVVNLTTNFLKEYKSRNAIQKRFLSLQNIASNMTTTTTHLESCKEPNLEDGGPIQPNTTLVTLDLVEMELIPFIRTGGAFEPKDCKAKYHVAIIIPFRDRYGHLSIFLRNIHPFLMKQNIAYRIFVIEQTNGQLFNRAALMNVGFLEALKIYKWDCFIFHDVDLLPLDDRNIYNCPRQPRHMSVALDTFHFRLPYRTIFGGVSAMTRKQFETVNGFSNLYFGWGGEDDDMSNRIKQSGFFISRYPVNIARYTMLKHQREKANPKRFEYLANTANKFKMDGLNSLRYEVYSLKETPTFTWFLIDLKITQPKS